MVRVAAVMKTGDDFHFFRVNAEDQAIRKAMESGPVDVLPHTRELVRIVAEPFKKPLVFVKKAARQCFADANIPFQRIDKFGLGG
ncbi:MAG: hypothetical protein P4M00_20100 [Azospirillaceae bacterium]|nr:hypothetical protein [Azospirillaceae bacterium]